MFYFQMDDFPVFLFSLLQSFSFLLVSVFYFCLYLLQRLNEVSGLLIQTLDEVQVCISFLNHL